MAATQLAVGTSPSSLPAGGEAGGGALRMAPAAVAAYAKGANVPVTVMADLLQKTQDGTLTAPDMMAVMGVPPIYLPRELGGLGSFRELLPGARVWAKPAGLGRDFAWFAASKDDVLTALYQKMLVLRQVMSAGSGDEFLVRAADAVIGMLTHARNWIKDDDPKKEEPFSDRRPSKEAFLGLLTYFTEILGKKNDDVNDPSYRITKHDCELLAHRIIGIVYGDSPTGRASDAIDSLAGLLAMKLNEEVNVDGEAKSNERATKQKEALEAVKEYMK
ncbi:MAG: hypothetical protein IT364_06245 [Candidatus Hydrogenedentes bacterium]|nr:hypothetical protein [Candidatus Hydrogenedentota bacterium]